MTETLLKDPPYTLEEKIKNLLIPHTLYYHFYGYWYWWKGEAEMKLLPLLLNKNNNSIDVGANRGAYSYWMQKYSKHVYAYEPNPKIFKLLKSGARGNITVSDVALSSASGLGELRVPKNRKHYSNQGASLSTLKVQSNYLPIPIETRRLDDESHNNIGFIKIDVEGHELAVLEGAENVLKRDQPILLIEIEEKHNKISIEKSISEISRLGYSCYVLKNGKLSDFNSFDPETNHRKPFQRSDYIFNFFFFPTDNPLPNFLNI